MQVDDGFYRGFGDWEGNEKFPHGMKWLADRMRELGLRPGIWFAPYIIAEGTEVYEKHPDWLIHNVDGKLKQVGPGLVEGSQEAKHQKPRRYALDITHPDAAAWFRRLFETAAHDWGYEFIKIDFVDWSVLAADQFFDRTMTRAAVYRRGFQIMRDAVGAKVHLLDCGPGQVSVGLLDSMRIELDQPPVNWNQYFLQSASSAPAAGKRYYFHKRTWINDDDHIVLAPLAVPQAQAAATLIALTGGTMISGDRMSDLDTNRLDILRKVYPSYGEAARPVDLFEGDRPEVFALPVKKSFSEWLVLGLFNSDEKNPVNKKIGLERLRLDPKQTYVAFDFWNQRFFGELRGEFQTRLEPASVRLLAIHEKRAHPFVISTDRHVIQGGLELESAMWDEGTSTISGVSLGPVGTTHNFYIYLPNAHKWVQGHPFFFYDNPHYTLKMMEPNILRVQVRFDESQRVAWKINTRQFFAPR
jgi:Melibiase